jgi:DNA-nicking Smr family endonuclease
MKTQPKSPARAKAPAKKKPEEAPPFRPFKALAKKTAAPRAAPPPPRAPEPATAEPESAPASFDAYMHGVKRLEGASRRIPRTVSKLEAPAKASAVDLDAPARAELARLVHGSLRFEVTDDGDVVEGRRLDVDPRELRRLRRQAYGIDGSVDLHGMSSEAARGAIERFLKRRRAEGDRAVLLIHGKGKHSTRGTAVLRGEIGAWLSQGASAREVLAFASVPEPEGPSGAVLVLLAKR